MTILTAFFTAFIPLLVAMDAIGVLPIYVGMVNDLDKLERKKVLGQAVLTATAVGFLFMFLGRQVFSFLNITVSDFKVAGGLILLLLAVSDLLFAEKVRQRPTGTVGVVPLGIPLMVGPATLTTLLVQVDLVGTAITLTAFVVNVGLSYLTFLSAGPIVHFLGKGGTQAVSKVANLLLASIAIMIIRMGILEIVQSLKGTL